MVVIASIHGGGSATTTTGTGITSRSGTTTHFGLGFIHIGIDIRVVLIKCRGWVYKRRPPSRPPRGGGGVGG